jgi:two-component system sensor histidine kinase UhpB
MPEKTSPIRILIVEDETIVAQDIRLMIEAMGYKAAGTATTGEGALELAAALCPDLILIDISLQGVLDGVETAAEIRRRHNKPVIFITAMSDPGTLQRAQGSEPFAYLYKPFEQRDLYAAVETALVKHRMEAALRESEERYRRLFEGMKSGVAVCEAVDGGKDFILLDFNEAAERIERVDRRRVVGRRLSEVFPGAGAMGLIEALRRVWRTGLPLLLPPAFYRDDRIEGWRDTTIYKLPSGEIVAVYDDVSEKRRAEEELRRTADELQRLADHLQTARENERTRIAHELHDELGQALTAMKMDIVWLVDKLPDDPRLRKRTADLAALADFTLKNVRQLSQEMRPGVLDDLGIGPAVEWLAGDFSERTGIPSRVSAALDESLLSKGQITALFRIVQEALTNVSRHARAGSVRIVLKALRRAVVLRITDNGRGITSDEISGRKSLGLVGMRERALAAGGRFTIEGRTGRGTKVQIVIPAPGVGRS